MPRRNSRTRKQWATLIAQCWQKGVKSIFETGALLTQAQKALEEEQGHGEWLKLIESDLPFGRRTASMLMTIAGDKRLTNGNHGSHLPPSWRTLYELSRLDDDLLEAAFKDGRINPEMERHEVAAIKILDMREAYEARKVKGDTVAALQALIDAERKFAVIYADPPWEFKAWSGKGKVFTAERHYDTAGLDVIAALPVESLAEKDCVLLLWAVMPELPGALEIISKWGFVYKTVGFNWIKQNRSGEGLFMGMGHWTRANSELCLLATRGQPTRMAKDVEQVLFSPIGDHSSKPEEVATRIGRLVNGPYLELFARGSRKGWTTWGNEIERAEYVEAAE